MPHERRQYAVLTSCFAPLGSHVLSSAAATKGTYVFNAEPIVGPNAKIKQFMSYLALRSLLLPSRLSREPTIDDSYRLRKFAAAVAEMRRQGSAAASSQQRRSANAVGERDRLPVGQEAREDALFKLLSELESVDSLAQATALLQGGGEAGGGERARQAPSVPLDKTARPDGAIELSASFQRRTSALCRERAEQAAPREPAAVPPNGKRAVPPMDESENGKVAADPEADNGAAAVAALRFRAAAFELYTVLESVKLNPAGEDEDEDPAFLPPGKRGWKHAALCEEAAGWAGMVRGAEGGRGAPLPSAELPEFQVREESARVPHPVFLCAARAVAAS